MLTVILPVYNAEAFICEAIESILNQTYSNFLLWIIDDGSSDSSVNLANKYLKDPRVTVTLHKENRGKLAVINEALEMVKTKYFTVHDADDVSHLARFEKQIHILENTPNVMCGTSFDSIDENGIVISETIQSADLKEIRKNIFSRAQFHGPTMIVQTDILTKVGGFYRIMKMGEDIDFSMRVVEKFPASNTTEILYSYRINPNSMTKSSTHDLLSKIVDRKLIYAFAEERKKGGKDSLMKNDLTQIEKFRNEARNDYYHYIDKNVNEYAGYLMHYDLKRNAFLNAFNTWKNHPKNMKLLRIVLYTLKKLITK